MRWPRWLTRRRIVWLLLAAIVAALVVLAVESVRAVRAFEAMRKDGAQLSAAISSGDLEGLRAAAQRLSHDAAVAHDATGNLMWTVASWTPVVGRNFHALATAAQAADALGRSGIPALIDVQEAVISGRLKPENGRLDPAVVAAYAPEIERAASAFDGPATQVSRLSSSGLVSRLRKPMTAFQRQVAEAKTALDALSSTLRVLPTILGADGPRSYLLLVQSQAEIRSVGGMPGTWALLHADDGKMTLVSVDPANVMAWTRPPGITLTAQEQKLFGNGLGLDPRDIGIDPDFPRVAQIAAAKYQAATGVAVSAVFTVDPQVLANVLQGTGPVTFASPVPGPTNVISAGNAVSLMSNSIYMTLTDIQANAFDSAAAGAVFQALVDGQGSQMQAIRGLVESVEQHHLLAWSPVPAIEQAIGSGSLSGSLVGSDSSVPQIGVYLNDAVRGKADYYLDQSSTVRSMTCRDGAQTIQLSTTLQSAMPSDAATLPDLVVGDGSVVPKGVLALGVYLVAPVGGTFESVHVGNTQFGVNGELRGRPVVPIYVTLQPGESATIEAVIRTAKGQTAHGELTWTPGMGTGTDPVSIPSAC